MFESMKEKIRSRKERRRMDNFNLEIQKKEERRAILELEIEKVDEEISALRDQVRGLMRKMKWRT
jgi:predicted  nucleic acid-binding Zn-ribbon protein